MSRFYPWASPAALLATPVPQFWGWYRRIDRISALEQRDQLGVVHAANPQDTAERLEARARGWSPAAIDPAVLGRLAAAGVMLG